MNGTRNVAASVRQRLLNRAREEKRPFQELLQYYAMERFLFRLSQSEHRNRFILKGALMLRVWEAPELRPTMDIDMLGRTDNAIDPLLEQIRAILTVDVKEDGITFLQDSLKAENITEDADYEGVRVRFTGEMSNARVNMQLDIGFGDTVYPEPELKPFPTLLEFDAPSLLCYSRESAIAEKLEAMIKLGEINSRMKDFYDIWLLARQFDFQLASLRKAIEHTFTRRRTAQPGAIQFPQDFAERKQSQWLAFHRRLNQDHVPNNFHEILATVIGFLDPVIRPIPEPTDAQWQAPGPWQWIATNPDSV